MVMGERQFTALLSPPKARSFSMSSINDRYGGVHSIFKHPQGPTILNGLSEGLCDPPTRHFTAFLNTPEAYAHSVGGLELSGPQHCSWPPTSTCVGVPVVIMSSVLPRSFIKSPRGSLVLNTGGELRGGEKMLESVSVDEPNLPATHIQGHTFTTGLCLSASGSCPSQHL